MSDEKKYTLRDMVMAQRLAFHDGARFQEIEHRSTLNCRVPIGLSLATNEALKLYPTPKITRSRAVPDPHGMPIDWTVVDGRIRPGVNWNSGKLATLETITPERVALWADLLANPTEEVEAES